MNFASDNGAGVAPEILAAIAAASRGTAAAYGADDWSTRAIAALQNLFGAQAAVFLAATGTAANALALAALVRPYEAVFCHEEAHVNDDECGAPEFFTGGAKLVGIPGLGGKITPAALAETLRRFPRGLAKSVQPAALTLSQATEAGTLYALDEIAALTQVAHAHGLKVHMDGARFANALVALGASAVEMTAKVGVDALSFGATKNGALACEAIVLFHPEDAQAFPYLRKRAGHTLSKGRFLGAQMCAYLEDGLWLRLAARANAAARRLSEGLAALPGIRTAWPTEANEAFIIAATERVARWRAGGATFYDWSTRAVAAELAPQPHETMIRLVTSFETRDAEIESLLRLARES